MDFELYAPVLVYIGVQVLSIAFPQIAWLLAPFRVNKDKLIKDALIKGIEYYSDETNDKGVKKVIAEVAAEMEVDVILHKEIVSRGLNINEKKRLKK